MNSIFTSVVTIFTIFTPSLTSTNNYSLNNIQVEQFLNTHNYMIKPYTINEDVNYSSMKETIIKNYDYFNEEIKKINNLLNEYEDNQHEILRFLISHYKKDNFVTFFDYMMNKQNINNKYLILSFLLDTNINIFEKWYVKYLDECINSNDISIKMKAKAIYDLYEDSFKEIIC